MTYIVSSGALNSTHYIAEISNAVFNVDGTQDNRNEPIYTANQQKTTLSNPMHSALYRRERCQALTV